MYDKSIYNLPTSQMCNCCGENLPLTAFNFRFEYDGIVKRRCRECESAENGARYERDKLRKRRLASDWQKENRERYLEYQRGYRQRRDEKLRKRIGDIYNQDL